MKFLVIFLILIGFVGIASAEHGPLHPEPTPACPEGTILKSGVCVKVSGHTCGVGTTYQGGICVVNEKDGNTNSSYKWTTDTPTLPKIDFDSPDRIDREVGYLGLMMLLPHVGQDETVVISLEGRPNLVRYFVDYYDIETLSGKTTPDDSFLSLFGKMTKANLQRFFEENPLNSFLKRGLSLYSVGSFTNDTGTYGPFNEFLTEKEEQKVGKILHTYESYRLNMTDIDWRTIIKWPTGEISDKYYFEMITNDSARNRTPGGSISSDRTIYPVPWETRSPLKQFKDGIDPKVIHCNDGLILIQRHDGFPACVKPETKQKLIERGWAISQPDVSTSDEPSLVERYKNLPEVQAFYERYDNVDDYVIHNRVIYAARSEGDFRVRLSLDFDKNPEMPNMDLLCYVGNKPPYDIPQEDILRYLENYHCMTYDTSEFATLNKAQKLGIDNTMEAVDSEDLTYDEKLQYIKVRYEKEGPVTVPSLNLRIKDFPRELDEGEQFTFTLVESGYANPCTSPKLEVYLVKGSPERYSISKDKPIYEEQIVMKCPPSDGYPPILHYWTEENFHNFPPCVYEGTHLIVGHSGTERHTLDQYYCNSSKQFENNDLP